MDRLEFRFARASKVEQICQQPIQALHLFADDDERCLPHLLRGLLRFNQIRGPVDARERISDFVRARLAESWPMAGLWRTTGRLA
jgi:hypothetical protein